MGCSDKSRVRCAAKPADNRLGEKINPTRKKQSEIAKRNNAMQLQNIEHV